MMKFTLSAFLLFSGVAIVNAQTFYAPVGMAAVDSIGKYNMSPDTACTHSNRSSALWCTSAVDFNKHFTLTFKASFDAFSPPGGDGICIVFGKNLTATSVNGYAGYLGYYDIDTTSPNPDFRQSLGIEIDLFDNNYLVNDSLTSDHIMIATNANCYRVVPGGSDVQIDPLNASVKDGLFHDYKITWDHNTSTLMVYYDNQLRMTTHYDYRDLFAGSSSVMWGFTAGIGLYCSNQVIKDISMINSNAAVENIQSTTADLAIFPNPVADHIQFKTNGAGINRIRIYSVSGQNLINEAYDNVKNGSIDVRSLPAGVYMIESVDKTGASGRRIFTHD